MSRSFKKHPVYKDTGMAKDGKKFSNKKIRNRGNLLLQRGSYKKLYEQYDIHDWINYWSWEMAKIFYYSEQGSYLRKYYPTENDFYNYWRKLSVAK